MIGTKEKKPDGRSNTSLLLIIAHSPVTGCWKDVDVLICNRILLQPIALTNLPTRPAPGVCLFRNMKESGVFK
jgi:hypothetical protein